MERGVRVSDFTVEKPDKPHQVIKVSINSDVMFPVCTVNVKRILYLCGLFP